MNDNQGLYGLLLRISGRGATLPHAVEIAFRAAQIVALIALLILIFRQRRALSQNRAALFAASAAIVSWLLIFSPIFWEHYLAYLAPFWGWKKMPRRAWTWVIAVAAYLLGVVLGH